MSEHDDYKRREAKREKDIERAEWYLNLSISEIEKTLSGNRDWERCKKFIMRCLSLRDYDRRSLHKHLLALLPYQDYLETFHWSEKRKEALERAKGKCQVCNSEEELNTHHRSYENIGCEIAEDLTVLCRNCHKMFHENGRLSEPQ